jgi:protein-tyrosine kinase
MNATIPSLHLQSRLPTLTTRLSNSINEAVLPDRDEAHIGKILFSQKILSEEQVNQVLQTQFHQPDPFGQIALRAGWCNPTDIEKALVNQSQFRLKSLQQSGISPTVVCAYAANGPYAHAIHQLRDRLSAQWLGRSGSAPTSALAIVGAAEGEGRSVTAANLAVSFAQMGRKTVLVDCDLRKSTLNSLLGRPNEYVGISELARNLCTFSDAISDVVPIRNLYFLGAGKKLRNPHDLFGRIGFELFMNALVRRFDAVIIDTPSMILAPESVAIARAAGSAMVIAKNGKTSLAGFEKLVRQMNDSQVHLAGSLFLE